MISKKATLRIINLLFIIIFLNNGSIFAQKLQINNLKLDSVFVSNTKSELNRLSTSAFTESTYVNIAGNKLLFRLLIPENTGKKAKYPLIVTLHNSSRIGNDNEAQLEPLARIWLKPTIQSRYQAFVLAPQFNTRSSNYVTDSSSSVMVSKPSPDVQTLYQLIRDLETKYPEIDTSRIYIIGYSMGASTAQNLLAIAPDHFAAIVSIAAVPDFSAIEDFKRKPFWLIHGKMDTENPYRGSLELFKSLNGNKQLRFTTYEHLMHNNIMIPFLESKLIPKWLFKHHKSY